MATVLNKDLFSQNSVVPSPLVRAGNTDEYFDPTRDL
jgi:hypothetical protein